MAAKWATALLVVSLVLLSEGPSFISGQDTSFSPECEGKVTLRTIEGDCNNVQNSKLGAAGHSLKRLPKHDPNLSNGFSSPGGPQDISPRRISNQVFAQSPGFTIMKDRAEELSGTCFGTRIDDSTWEVCPFLHAKAVVDGVVEDTIPWNDIKEGNGGDLYFSFKKSDDCELKVIFKCDGEEALVISTREESTFTGDVCGKSGWLYSPKACMIIPGADGTGTSNAQLTDLFWTFGQFVDHDFILNPGDKDVDSSAFQITVPEGDFFIDESTLEFDRGELSDDQVNQVNKHSAYLELAQVYGVDNERADALRAKIDGKLKEGPRGLLPRNSVSGEGALGVQLENDPDTDPTLFVGGDIRVNEQTLLLCMHTLWVREHNLVCDELKESFPDWEDERLYQTARAIVISEYQSILYSEWLSILLGSGAAAPEAYSYSPSVDPSVMAVFSGAAFRFGHSMVSTHLWKVFPDGSRELLPLRDAFFNPELVARDNIDVYLRGGALHVAREVDTRIVDELRNFLFTEDADSPHMDLVSLNIQRGRDIGLPTYNQAREAYGLTIKSDFSEISSDTFVWKTLRDVYDGNIDAVDAFVGGLAEDHVGGSQLGELFHAAIQDQFVRSRDGDRFFYVGYQWAPFLFEGYPRLTSIINNEVKLHNIITRNTEVTETEVNVFGSGTVFRA